MLYKIEGLTYVTWISVTESKVTLIIVFNGPYQPSWDENIVSVAWVINCTDIDIYA